jgi:hypothetical protein
VRPLGVPVQGITSDDTTALAARVVLDLVAVDLADDAK